MFNRLKRNYNATVAACFTGYVVQAVINNFIPLLFITIQDAFSISLTKITMLVTANFAVQLVIDMMSALFVDKIGYRISIVSAHIFAALGLVMLAVLPYLMSDPYLGILISVIIYAVGGGIIEVLISPIMESCPTDNKEKAMSLLHSFYCWGQVGVILFSTLFFKVWGLNNWRILSCLWAFIPVINGIAFCITPINNIIPEDKTGLSIKQLVTNRAFLIFIVIMLCSGASEMTVSQWSSMFAERGLGISKAAGDLAGPMAFAVLMGISRALYGKFGDKINLDKFMLLCGCLCIISYIAISIAPYPVISLVFCAICGLSVGIMWPGTFSKAAASIRYGGTAMFALLALAGDIGCSMGPTFSGFVSSCFENNIALGILASAIFPIVFVICVIRSKIQNR